MGMGFADCPGKCTSGRRPAARRDRHRAAPVVPSLQADPLMITSSFSAFALILSIGLNLVALYYFLRMRRPAPPASGAGASERWALPAEALVEPVAPAAAISENANPLVEAEVFLIYGRNDDAAQVLKAGLRDGRIGAEDLSRFWARHGGWPSGDGALAGAGR